MFCLTSDLQGSTRFQEEYGDLKSMMEDLRTNSSMRILNLKKHLCLKGEEHNMQTDPRCMLCPSTWHLIGVTCYYISRGLKSWHESKRFCDSRNSTLLIINEDKILKTLPKNGLDTYSWIGIHKDKGGQWIWANGTHIAQLPKGLKVWNIENTEECAYLYGNGAMYVQTCDKKYQWICEKAGIELA
ncbi:C-type lectin domain family 10 member A-like [Sceloporus undulatus]|uniref:C-type lectin domain family 10 member A-like n=1 Tax=Sceloporus undulatus TaxID=8520 RepID=UPI001C4AD67E|nr:C-type lectin domain family 10 member A-like [Sceloporus undulatus]